MGCFLSAAASLSSPSDDTRPIILGRPPAAVQKLFLTRQTFWVFLETCLLNMIFQTLFLDLKVVMDL